MQHAGEQPLDTLEPLLAEGRAIPGLQEKKRGTFYQGASAFIHCHEDPAGCLADLKGAAAFHRFSVNTRRERRAFLTAARAARRPQPRAFTLRAAPKEKR